MTKSLLFSIFLILIITSCQDFNDEPKFPKIAYASAYDFAGNYQIYVMDYNGSNKTQLTFLDNSCEYPVWSPDGSKIAFFSKNTDNQYSIFVMNKDGTNLRQISPSTRNAEIPYSPSWDQTGRLVYYSICQNVMVSQILEDSYKVIHDGNGDIFPEVSNDGSKVVFINMLGGDVCTIDVDGKNFKNLTNGTVYGWRPKWSFNNNYIVFHDSRAGRKICIIDTLGANVKTLRYNSGGYKWSQDGTKLIFNAYYENVNSIFIYDMIADSVINLSNNMQYNLPEAVSNCGVDWSSDGEYILYHSERDSDYNSQIIVVELKGNKYSQLTTEKDNKHGTFEPE